MNIQMSMVTKVDNSCKAALITGGAKRLGAFVAKHLVRQGYGGIAIHCNASKTEAKELEASLKAINPSVDTKIYTGNLTDAKFASGLITEVAKQFSGLSLVINNASVFTKSSCKDFNIDDFDTCINLHVKSPCIITKSFYHLISQSHLLQNLNPSVVNIIDANFKRAKTMYFNYLLSKKMLFEASRQMSVELAPLLRVNCVMPGYIMAADSEEPSYLARLETQIPLKRKGDAQDIADAISYLSSSTYLTGQWISVDGGYHLVNE